MLKASLNSGLTSWSRPAATTILSSRLKNEISTGKILHLDGDRKYSEKSRRYYNGSARQLNEYARKIPSCIVASLARVKEIEYFTIKEEERENVKVEF